MDESMDENGDPGRTRKRPRREDGFRKGSLKRIRVGNFMTYKKVELVARPHLNIILGPNGTGKSSLVCALCLGLAGKPKLLGRADNVKDFVLRGEQEGYTEVTISGGGEERDRVVRRDLHSKDNTSTWKIDGRPSTMQEVEKLKDKMNIQLDNLCQFLPQDRVVEFARLTPTELLFETEKAIGNSKLCDLHRQLIEKGSTCSQQRQCVATIEKELAKANQAQEQTEREVKRFEHRESLLKTVEVAKAKLQWAEVRVVEERLKTSKQKLKAAKQAVKTALDQEKKAKMCIAPLTKEREKCKRETTIVKQNCCRLTSAIERQAQQASNQVENLKSQAADLKNIELESREYHKKIKATEESLRKAQASLDSLGQAPPEHHKKMQDLRMFINDCNTEARGYRRDMDNIETERSQARRALNAIQDKLKRLKDVKLQRIRNLEGRRHGFRGLLQAYEWLQQNQNKFRSRVYGPICAEVAVADKQNAAYLEGNVALQIWTCFVTTNRDDSHMLRSMLTQEGIMRGANVLCYEGDPGAPLRNSSHTTAIPQFGITHTLDEGFEAPNVVKQALNIESGISNVLIGTRKTEGCMEELLKQHRNVTRVCTPGEIVSVKFSKYGGGVRSTASRATPEPSFLGSSSSGGDEQESLLRSLRTAEQTIARLDGQHAEHERHYREAQQKLNEATKEREVLSKQEHGRNAKRKKLQEKVKMQERSLKKLCEKPDPKEEEPERQQALKDCMERFLRETRKGMGKLMDWRPEYEKLTSVSLHSTECSAQLAKKMDSFKDFELEVQKHQRIHDQIVHIVHSDERELRKAKEEADRDYPMTNELQAKFADVPDNNEELEEFIDNKQAEADGIICANSSVVDQYMATRKAIDKYEKQLRSESLKLQDLEAMINTLKGEWLPELRKVVEKINVTFGRNFAKIGCVGEVRLAEEDSHGDHFDKYAVEIMVKFRDQEDLTPLDASRQSGGERSVSTMLYLISLQNVTETPFRVVDEINQGMDSNNERKVFDQLVESASLPGTPQCFLITPKLLPNLSYSENVTTHTLFNGPSVKSIVGTPASGLLEKLCGSRIRQRLA
ncbi:unnamed protein product [Ostreobium quekettii]|uniref:Structural maintenance of chromosomes protein 5 n=1 Tax=Ostreobium quekettii TaxID=121088 RepID=A0A8S1ILX3_9CHLO|nr:unnamed protein product [Ostreobium quekettii]|eukprot:evm.model.scf_24.6 EVM.evm.TU.scf_24.6   scf_24:61881-79060(-)